MLTEESWRSSMRDAEYLDEDLDFTFEDWEMPEQFSHLQGMQ